LSHKRIRPFNTRDTYPEQRLDNDLAQAVVARGTMVFLRGQVAQDLDTAKNVGGGDAVAQTHKVMQNVRQLLGECGAEMGHVTKLVVYLTDIRYREAVYRTMGEYIRGVHPVCTGLVVVALARPEWLVEIDATAVIPDTSQ
jgi:enamine deaminase RidA (YjgF/YER057c/UK114 family)